MQLVFLSNNCNITFIENELQYLVAQSEVSSISIYTDSFILNKEIAENKKVKVHIYNEQHSQISQSNRITDNLFVLKLFIIEVIQNTPLYKSKDNLLALFRTIRNELRKSRIIEYGEENKEALFVSYWASNEALGLAILKKRHKIRKAITRLHAYDLYEEFNKGGRIPFRKFILKQLDYLFPVSKDGVVYLQNKYPKFKNKIALSYLGSYRKKELINTPDANTMRIISCGRVTPHKRHLLNFEILNTIPNAEWWHIGDGDDFEKLKQEVNTKGKIKVHLPGNCSQNEIVGLYQTKPFTCFLSLSTTEGIPVSMMEAISYGIPVVSTDVGGCREIVTEKTGVLIPEELTSEMVVKGILECQTGKFSTIEGRNEVVGFWNEYFNANTNYRKYLHQLLEIKNEI